MPPPPLPASHPSAARATCSHLLEATRCSVLAVKTDIYLTRSICETSRRRSGADSRPLPTLSSTQFSDFAAGKPSRSGAGGGDESSFCVGGYVAAPGLIYRLV